MPVARAEGISTPEIRDVQAPTKVPLFFHNTLGQNFTSEAQISDSDFTFGVKVLMPSSPK